MITNNRRSTLAALLLLLFLLCFSTLPVMAAGKVIINLPDDGVRNSNVNVARAETFTVHILIPPSVVKSVQVNVEFDASVLTFVRDQSILMDTTGNNCFYQGGGEGNSQARAMNLTNGRIVLLAYQKNYNASNGSLAALTFTVRKDAGLNPISVTVTGDSMVETEAAIIDGGTREPIRLNVIEATPLPSLGSPTTYPAATKAPTTAQPTPSVNPSTTVTAKPTQAAPAGQTTVITVAVTNTAPQVSATKASSATTPVTTAGASPLRSDLGEDLYIPAGLLPKEQIPAGFVQGTQNLQGVNIPSYRSDQRNLTLYYLQVGQSGQNGKLYTYNMSTKRFSLFDLRSLQTIATTTSEAEAKAFKTGNENEPSPILLGAVGLVGLSALGTLIYSASRNLNKRR